MKTFKIQDYTINICTDILEWAKEFYAMPDGATLANEEEVKSECMGFAQIDDKEIWIFVPQEYDMMDLKETISHEMGHIVEFKYPNNVEQIESNRELHELKADHYMDYYMVTDEIIMAAMRVISKID